MKNKLSSEAGPQTKITNSEFIDSLEATVIGGRPFLECDFEKYKKYFDNSDYSDEIKMELIRSLWNFVVTANSYNLNKHIAPKSHKNCGNLRESSKNSGSAND